MTLFEIVALYVALNIILLIVLSYRVSKTRRKHSVGIGDEGQAEVLRAIRVHGNFTEYAPLALIGLFVMAGLDASPYWLHGVGIAFTMGRTLHAIGFSASSGVSKGRFLGIVLTWITLLVIAVYLLYNILT